MARINTVLVANRGEIAVRVIRTCRELGIRTVAVYSDADAEMPHVALADAAIRIGPAPSTESYLNVERILEAARAAQAEAVHPGYGFLSENAGFASAVARHGFLFVGPPAEVIRAMGDKTEARKMMSLAGIPIVPGTDGPVATVGEARAFCRGAGFPVLLKAAAGGGGKGMRKVSSEDELTDAFSAASSEALSSFGDGRLFVEKYLEGARHIEFQIVADAAGNVVHLGERDCSVQRRHQKIVEESPSPFLDEALRTSMGETAVRAARACGYVNAGTIEFLVDEKREFYFLEMNTRLQVEHPITEVRTGLDLVALQLQIAAGGTLPFTQDQVPFNGHAIECRLCAEDPVSFMPDTGRIVRLRPAQGPGVREDRGIDVGNDVSVYYDSLLSKLVVWAPTRTQAIARMRRALLEYELIGVRTNIPLCHNVMRSRAFIVGTYDTRIVDQLRSPENERKGEESAAAVLAAWLDDRRAPVAGAGRKNASPRSAWDSDGRLRGWKEQRRLFGS